MKLAAFLQGHWLGHPLHPALVHLPVGAWMVATLLDLISAAGSSSVVLEKVALGCVALGLAGALLAVPPGVADWGRIKQEKPAWKLGLWHMLLNLLATLLFGLNFGLRLSSGGEPGEITLPVLLTSVLGCALLLGGVYSGTRMVFAHGTGVGRQSKAKWRQLARRGGARLPEET